MTVKELIRELVNLPVPLEDATVIFEDGRVIIVDMNSDSICNCYVISR